MSPPDFGICSVCPRFPRVSGDEPAGVAQSADGYTFSPRERG